MLKENVDGEAIEWAVERLDALPTGKKLLIVISDGAPVDDSTLLQNHPRILENHLKEVLKNLACRDDFAVASIGLDYDTSHYYRNSLVVDGEGALNEALPDFLFKCLTNQTA